MRNIKCRFNKVDTDVYDISLFEYSILLDTSGDVILSTSNEKIIIKQEEL